MQDTSIMHLALGFRIDGTHGVRLVGIDEINNAISQGCQVVSVEGGGVIMEKVNDDDREVRMLFRGCDLKVTLKVPGEG